MNQKQKETFDLVSIKDTETFNPNSGVLEIEIGKKYLVTANVRGIKGKPDSAFLGVINLNNKNKEIERKVSWLNDFSGVWKKVHILFQAPTSRVVLVYRINNETPKSSYCEFELTSINNVLISEVDSELEKKLNDVDSISLLQKGLSSDQVLERWKIEGPNSGLTWGKILTGDAFINLAKKFNIFSPDKSILELGPGYGRILSSILSHKIPFKSYTGVDISSENIDYLRKKFEKENINFVKGNFSSVKLEKKYDIVLSSAVLKHQFPTFQKSFKNIQHYVNDSGIFFFDLRENLDNTLRRKDLDELLKLGPQRSNWDKGTKTFVGFYSQTEVEMILKSLSQDLVGFDHVVHDEQVGERLVVISRLKSSHN